MTNCPNCGAPITGPKCEYCGTVHTSLKTVCDDKEVETFKKLRAKQRRLEIESELLKTRCDLTDLYYDVLKAMRKYSE